MFFWLISFHQAIQLNRVLWFRSNHRMCSAKKVFLKASQNSQENTCARASFLIKSQAPSLHVYWKRVSGTGVFLVNFFKNTFLIEHLRWLLLLVASLTLNQVPVDTGRKLNIHKTFGRCPGRLLNVLCTFNLRPVSTGVE